MGRWARISSWGMGEEVGAAGTPFRMSVADFFHAFGSRMDDIESGRSIGGRMGWNFDVGGMRRRWGRRAHNSRVHSRFFSSVRLADGWRRGGKGVGGVGAMDGAGIRGQGGEEARVVGAQFWSVFAHVRLANG
jgi:hypothetical protein